ncbi:TIGR00300 family protein [Phycisphaeraceae bacterium D3-23]
MTTGTTKPRVLMCPPDHFGVEYVINPWMEGQIGRVDVDVAQAQWQRLHDTLAEFADVELVRSDKGLPDMVFAANAGLLLGDKFVPSNFFVPERDGEVPLFNQWFGDNDFEIVELPANVAFEGEGDALFHPGQPLLWAGYGCRSSIEAHPYLTDIFNVEVVSLRLVDTRFYHLDTCFYPLPDNKLVYYAPAFDERSRREIERRIPKENRIEIGDDDAMHFNCNTVRLGKTLITSYASGALQEKLRGWGYDVRVSSVSEFLLAGGAAKCLTLLLQQDLGPDADQRGPFVSPIRSTKMELRGHLLDDGMLNRAMDVATNAGLGCRVDSFTVAERSDQHSRTILQLTAPNAELLDTVVNELTGLGAMLLEHRDDAHLESVTQDGVVPEGFYSSTIYPTDVRVGGQFVRASHQRMDGVLVVSHANAKPSARCTIMRDVKVGDQVVCGSQGLRVHMPQVRKGEGDASGGDFSFMSSSVSSERRVEQTVDTLAWEMKRIRERGGRIAVVAGPVVVHTGGGRYLTQLIEAGYVQALLTGNALPTHDIEHHLYGTSLGLDLDRGVGVSGGHKHHLKAINKVRAAGSIKAAVEQGVITGGVMHACVKHNVDYVLAGSIRDDGPLPDTEMDLIKAQAEYARAIEGCEMILMLSSMLHAIGTGNMTPAGVKLVCVDISPAVVTKLADRGSVESVGIVTDVGLLLNLLAARLCKTN